jgi:FtsH-binding integral membrane protein
MSRISARTRSGLAVVAICAWAFAVYGAVESFLRGDQGSSAVQVAASLACIGVLFGAIFAFHPSPAEESPNQPGLRVMLSGAAGLCLGFLYWASGEALAISTLVFAALGYIGRHWVKWL